MNLFEFLMILLSLIVGFGLAEILSGVARRLKREGIRGLSWLHGTMSLIIFIALLQTFWEAWGLRSIATWSFPAMLLMLGSPVLLFIIAHIIYPESDYTGNLDDYYFERARMLWATAGLTVVVGTLFRPIAFGLPLVVIDNASAAPILIVCVLLSTINNRRLHQISIPIVLLIVLLDTLAVSYSIE